MQDWTQAVRRPPAYLVNKPWLPANSWNSRNLIRFLSLTLLTLFFFLVIMLCTIPNQRVCPSFAGKLPVISSTNYNSIYPLTKPTVKANGETAFRIAIITDLDHDSKLLNASNKWFSYLRYGWLYLSSDQKTVRVDWDSTDHQIKSGISAGGRGMELSDLKVFDGCLLTVDDRTGIVYRIENADKRIVPWTILVNGAGNESEPFKAEWMAMKDRWLYVGGLGKEWTTTTGELQNFNPMWIKLISPAGEVHHVNWYQVYVDLRKTAGIIYPGYMVHESAQWSTFHQRWFFLPRRASKQTYTETDDEKRGLLPAVPVILLQGSPCVISAVGGTNIMLVADESFKQIEMREVGPLIPTHGFSAFQFIPYTNDNLIVALKSEENEGTIASYITVFDVLGNVLMKEEKLVGNFKFEGIEFV